jgi:hypothetical protein
MRIKSTDSVNLEALKKQFTDIAGKDKVIYEDDYERICSSIGDTRVVGELQTWLVSSGLQMKKRDPRYERKLKNLMHHPNVNKVRTSMKSINKKSMRVLADRTSREDQSRGWERFNELKGLRWDHVVEAGAGNPTEEEVETILKLQYWGEKITPEGVKAISQGIKFTPEKDFYLNYHGVDGEDVKY